MHRWIVVLGSLLIACGASSRGGQDRSELVIEMRPVDALRWTAVLDDTLHAEDSLSFAWADGYPSSLEVTIGQPWSTCGSLTGTFAIESVESLTDGLVVTQTGADAFRVAPTSEGDFEAVVRGTFVAAELSCVGTEVPFELAVHVPVRRPVGVVLDPPSACEQLLMESDARLDGGIGVQLVDDAGAPFRPSNAAPTHPATLTLQAAADTSLALFDPELGLDGLVISGAPGPVQVSAFAAPQDVIDHIAPDAIELVGVHWGLLGAAGGPTALETGQVYGEGGWSRTTNSIGISSSGLEVDGQRVCTLPREGGFTLTSSTPQSCITFAASGHGVGPYGDSPFDPPLPVSADVLASGSCLLQLEGQDYGFAEELAVEILNADNLIDLGGEGR